MHQKCDAGALGDLQPYGLFDRGSIWSPGDEPDKVMGKASIQCFLGGTTNRRFRVTIGRPMARASNKSDRPPQDVEKAACSHQNSPLRGFLPSWVG